MLLGTTATEGPVRDGHGTIDVQRVRAAIAQLPPAERDVLVLRFAAGLGTDETAAILGTSPAVIRGRLHHAGWVVEDLAGVSPVGAPSASTARRPADLVEEEAAVGITPLLAARLAAAVTGELPAADDHWRLHAVVRGLRTRSDGLLTALLVATAALPAAVSLAQL